MGRIDEAAGAVRERAVRAVEAADGRVPVPLAATLRRCLSRDILLQASSLAFYGLISSLPMLIIAFSIVGAVTGEGTLDRFATSVSSTGPQGTGRMVEQLVSSAESLSWVTLLFAVWPATAYGGGLRRALQHAAGDETELAGLRGRIMGIGLVLALPLLMLGGIPLVFVLTNVTGDGTAARVLGWLIALGGAAVAGTATTAVLYRAFAPGDLRWRDSIRGAALTSGTTAAFSLLFVLYLNIGDVGQRFGGGTSALVVMLGLWLFVANILLLAGYHAVLELDGDGS